MISIKCLFFRREKDTHTMYELDLCHKEKLIMVMIGFDYFATGLNIFKINLFEFF